MEEEADELPRGDEWQAEAEDHEPSGGDGRRRAAGDHSSPGGDWQRCYRKVDPDDTARRSASIERNSYS